MSARLSAAQRRALASALRDDGLRGRITQAHATRATMRALKARGLVTIEVRHYPGASRRRDRFEYVAALTEAGWEATR